MPQDSRQLSLKEIESKGRHVYTVSQITQDIKLILENTFHEVWVEGEVSNFRQASSGHLYFTLKDSSAVLATAMFQWASKGLKFKLEDGLKIICFGKIDVYPPRGQHQLIVEKIEPQGIGAQQLAFEQLKKKLDKEGLFDPKHKRELALMPFRLGIVTSSAGAAVRDILQILKKGASCVDIIIRSVRVQGDAAAKEIACGIEDFNKFGQVDTIIVCRGGGSSEDLWSFNEEVVARAIYNSKIPVISAVGHQINITLSDLVADVFVETPSAAAKIIVDKKNALLKEIVELRHGMSFILSEKIAELNNKIVALRHMLKSPLDRLSEKQQLLDESLSGLNNNMRHFMDIYRERFNSLKNRLQAFSPLAVLSRGYSLSMLMPEGQVVKDAAKLKPGDQIKTVLNKGSFTSLVQDIFQSNQG